MDMEKADEIEFVPEKKLRSALKKIDQHIESQKALLLDLEKRRLAICVLLGEADFPTETPKPVAEAARKLSHPEEVAVALVDILEKEFMPLKTSELVGRLKEIGIELGQNRPDVRVWGIMKKRNDLFERDEERRWSLVNEKNEVGV